jgi:hypothetical protein
MKYLKSGLLILLLALLTSTIVHAQKQPPRQRRTTKNPPQYPHIIEGSQQPGAQPAQNETTTEDKGEAKVQTPPANDLLLVKAVVALTGEVRGLVQEMRSLNIRQQAQLDMLRLTRADLRIEQYERELRATRDRLTLLKAEDQNLDIALRPESLELQVNNMATFDRSQTMRQLKANYEARQRVVRAELETMQQREQELAAVVEGLRNLTVETEKRLQEAEELLKQMNAPPPAATQEKTDKPPPP